MVNTIHAYVIWGDGGNIYELRIGSYALKIKFVKWNLEKFVFYLKRYGKTYLTD